MSTDGDILRCHWPLDPGRTVPLYLGTGRLGGCFNAWGLHDPPPAVVNPRVGHTVLCHRELWSHGRFGIDHQTPAARLLWAEEPPAPTHYRQHLDLAAGTLRVTARHPRYTWQATVATCPAAEARDTLEWDLTWTGRLPALRFAPVATHTSRYDDAWTARIDSVDTEENGWTARWRLGSADGWLHVHVVPGPGRARLRPEHDGARIALSARGGRCLIRIVMGPWIRRAALGRVAARLAREADGAGGAAGAWRRLWRRAHLPRVSDPARQALTLRSVAYLLGSFEPAAVCPPPPAGFSGNQWGFHFPQDTSFVLPALLSLGFTDLARGVVEFYASRRAQMEEFTRRTWRVPGTFWAWEFPLGADTRPLLEGAPNPFQFELHNAAYPARMAWETALALNDRAWLREIAWPIIHGSATFYAALLRRERDGSWGLRVTPSMGQDEYGGANAPNYLCALFAADYTLRLALRAAGRAGCRGLPALATWRRILTDGLAFPRLLDHAHGIYATCEGTAFTPGRQKHPVQLAPITFLPSGRRLDGPTRRALQLRDHLARSERDGHGHPGVRGSYYDGWTLSALWLADARAGDSAALETHLREAPAAQYVDPEWVQIYESSGFWHPYYLTSHGLFLQAMFAAQDPSADS